MVTGLETSYGHGTTHLSAFQLSCQNDLDGTLDFLMLSAREGSKNRVLQAIFLTMA
jgi:hypothetical protein